VSTKNDTGDACVVADGQKRLTLAGASEEPVTIRKADVRAKFIRLRADDFFDQVRRKFYPPDA
jgi:NAD kinase